MNLPLVLTVNCLQDCELERDVLREVARVESITGFTKKHISLIKQVGTYGRLRPVGIVGSLQSSAADPVGFA